MVVIVNGNVLPTKDPLEPISPVSKKKYYKKIIKRRPRKLFIVASLWLIVIGVVSFSEFRLRDGIYGAEARSTSFNTSLKQNVPHFSETNDLIEELVEISSAEARCDGENEEWKPCGINCDATCVPPRNCTESNCDQGAPACGCKPGYVRQEGLCIPFRNCPNVNYCYIHCPHS